MSYVLADTAPTFGMRSQALSPMASRLGYYMRSGFPLPTTSLSRPIRPGMGSPFFEGPYPQYPQPEQSRTRASATQTLQGEWVPPTPPGRALWSQGAVTYRINPQTGQYEFHSTDILPRGLWQQNTFQHPVRPALSSLGVPMNPHGCSMVQLHGRQMVMKTTPRKHSCKCGGKCGGKQLAGIDDPCTVDSDCGPGFICGGAFGDGRCVSVEDAAATQPVTPGVGPQWQGVVAGAGASLQKIASAVSAMASPFAPRVAVAAPVNVSWFNQSTAGIPNVALAGFAAIALLALKGGRR